MKNKPNLLSLIKKIFGGAVIFALALSFVGSSSTEAFASDVTIKNNGYFYGTSMASSVTFVVETEGDVTSVQWQVANSKNGEYTNLDGVTTKVATFTPTTDKWYRCCINGSLYTEPLMAISGNTSTGSFTYKCDSAGWYLSNGTMAYSLCYDNLMDIVGYYEKNGNKFWLQTSFGGDGWRMSGTDSSSEIRFTFDKANPVIVYCDVVLASASPSFAIDCDTQLGNNNTSSNGWADGAALAARTEGNTLTQIEMVGTSTFDACQESDAAIVIKAPGCSHFWIGEYDDRRTFQYNTSNGSGYTNANFNGVNNVVVEVNDTDSGMAISWANPAEGKVHFQFNVGTAAAAGVSACAAVAKASCTTVTVSDASSEQYYALFDSAGNMIRSWTNDVDSNNEIVFRDLEADTEYVVKTITKEQYDLVEGRVEEIAPEDIEETDVQTAVNPLQPEEGVSEDSYLAPSILTYDTAIVIKHANPDYVYRLLNESGRSAVTDYVEPDSNGYAEFTGLNPDTTYQLDAKSGDNDTCEWTEVKTLPAVSTPTVDAGATTVTVTNPQNGIYYAIFDTEGKLKGGWSRLISGGRVKFSGLEQATDYVLLAICQTDYNLVANEGADPMCPKLVNVKTGIDIKAAAEQGGNDLRIVPTDDGCKVLYANPAFEYGVMDENDVLVKAYTTPNLENSIKFTGLSSSTKYYLVAKKGLVLSPDKIAFTTLAEGDSLYGKIDYTKREEVKIYAFDEQGGELDNVYINMTQEKLVASGFSYQCYSIDGGKKWKQGKISDAAFKKLYDSGFSLALGSKYNKDTKKLDEDATVIYFDKVSRRPVSRSYKVNYKTYADAFGLTNGQWTLTWNGSAVDMTNVEIGISDSTGKKIGKEGYGIWPDADGVWVPNSESKDKTTSYSYYYRTMATTVSGASKAKKIKVSGLVKAPKIKVDYNKETIKIPVGYNVYFGTKTPNPLKDRILYDPNEILFENIDPANVSKFEDYDGKGLTKLTAAVSFSLAGYITESRNTILIWGDAKETKPATAKQELKLAARAKVSNKTLSVKNGKITDFPKEYEIFDDTKQKWSTILPKFTDSAEVKVRVKNQAKGGKENNDNKATSAEGLLTVTWGTIDKDKGTEGIVSAKITK